MEHDPDTGYDDAVEVDTFDDSPDDAEAMGDIDVVTDDFDAGDSVPGDSVPGDSVPGDSASGDSASGDTAHGDIVPSEMDPDDTVDITAHDTVRAFGDVIQDTSDIVPTETAASVDIDVAVLDGIEKELADVELALRRLGDGSYGTCENCGQVVTDEELEEAPAGRFCRAHLPLTLP